MDEYDDIINLPPHVSKTQRQMPMEMRAAQFAPFAALTGYDAVINETARLTDQQVELEDYDNERLNRKYAELIENISEHPVITVSYFKPDKHKGGGAYVSKTGHIKKVDTYEQLMLMENGTAIPLAAIVDIVF